MRGANVAHAGGARFWTKRWAAGPTRHGIAARHIERSRQPVIQVPAFQVATIKRALPSLMYPPHEKERLEREEQLCQEFNRWALAGRSAEMEQEHGPVAEKVIDRMALDRRHSVLEVGCGDGWASRRLARLCPEGAVVGIDLSDEMIDLARRKSVDFNNVLFNVGAAEEIPWAEDYFDRVLSIESAYYWPSPERAVREMFRVTAYGGRVDTAINYYQENPHSHHWQEHVGLPLHLKSATEWVQLFADFGFERVESCRIPDETPVPEDFQPDVHWSSREERIAFQRIGALLITARKPSLPPPGPNGSDPDPLRVL